MMGPGGHSSHRGGGRLSWPGVQAARGVWGPLLPRHHVTQRCQVLGTQETSLSQGKEQQWAQRLPDTLTLTSAGQQSARCDEAGVSPEVSIWVLFSASPLPSGCQGPPGRTCLGWHLSPKELGRVGGRGAHALGLEEGLRRTSPCQAGSFRHGGPHRRPSASHCPQSSVRQAW